ncbi:hypothetical protein MTX20_25640 [Bradyrhizobium sp. ISRA435]|nr:hypothetical protein MTX20_25640 [Bradyrhizobium sp. ISRA435]
MGKDVRSNVATKGTRNRIFFTSGVGRGGRLLAQAGVIQPSALRVNMRGLTADLILGAPFELAATLISDDHSAEKYSG